MPKGPVNRPAAPNNFNPTITEIRKQMGKSPKPSPKSLGSSSSRVSHVIP
ncbi:MAG: hypothetical protein V8S36_01775 [Lachnospiraceae bacterium]